VVDVCSKLVGWGINVVYYRSDGLVIQCDGSRCKTFFQNKESRLKMDLIVSGIDYEDVYWIHMVQNRD
jgi:hypothetical protein